MNGAFRIWMGNGYAGIRFQNYFWNHESSALCQNRGKQTFEFFQRIAVIATRNKR